MEVDNKIRGTENKCDKSNSQQVSLQMSTGSTVVENCPVEREDGCSQNVEEWLPSYEQIC